jgi:hypothetical protein
MRKVILSLLLLSKVRRGSSSSLPSSTGDFTESSPAAIRGCLGSHLEWKTPVFAGEQIGQTLPGNRRAET